MIFDKEKIEYQMIRETARKFASKIPVEKIKRFEETETYPYPFVEHLGKLGLMGILFGLWLGKKWWHIVYEN